MGIVRYLRDIPPAHCILKIDSFETLLHTVREKFDSGIFEASGYKWKLSFYPNGRTLGDGAGHISLYLESADPASLQKAWPVNVYFKMFVLEKKLNQYLTILDDYKAYKPGRFDTKNLQWGFDQLITRDDFKDPSKGYLVNEACVFGVEVFVEEFNFRTKGESMSVVTVDPILNSYQWPLTNFSRRKDEVIYSPEFPMADLNWKLEMWPKGHGSYKGEYFYLGLVLVDADTLPRDGKTFVQVDLTVQNQVITKDVIITDKHWFGSHNTTLNYDRFMLLSELNNASNGFLARDMLTVAASISAITVTEDF